MNDITKQIMDRFNVTIDQAKEIQEIEEIYCCPDYSEDSQLIINIAHDEAHQIWKVGAENYFAAVKAHFSLNK